MMKLYRAAVILLFLAVSGAFLYTFVTERLTADTSVPVISLEDDVLELSVNAKDRDFLDGVTAFDEKDGDITDKIIVESVSKFIKPGICKVTYAVCDDDNHVAIAVRKVRYTDYTPPRYSLKESPCYSVYEAVNIKNSLTVSDCFDGKLDGSMILTSNDYATATEGVFNIDVTVTNSMGDTSVLTFPLIVENRSLSAPEIELSQYLLYLDKGEEIDPEEYIVSAVDYKEKDILRKVTVDTNLNVNKEGTYIVHYYAVDDRGERGHSIMIVMVGNAK